MGRHLQPVSSSSFLSDVNTCWHAPPLCRGSSCCSKFPLDICLLMVKTWQSQGCGVHSCLAV